MVLDFIAERGLIQSIEGKDLVQEILIHWVTQKQRYDEDRSASIQTFFRKIARNRLEDVYREQKAGKRGGGSIVYSLEKPVDPEEQDGAVLGDYVADATDVESEAESKIECDRILELLTSRQRKLVHGLAKGYLLTEIARKMKVPRTTLKDELTRIRRILRNNGYESNDMGNQR